MKTTQDHKPTRDLDELAAHQRLAADLGRAAERAGHAVIYIHGRPYVDPDAEQ